MITEGSEPVEKDDLLWQHLKTLPAFRAILRAIEARFYHQFELPEPILDLGCGDGDFAEHTFNEHGRRINIGLDPWIGPLTHSVEAGIYDLALQGEGAEMPFPSGHFASALSNSVLEHIPDIQPVLNETGRVLAHNGIFLMTMPNHRFTEMLGGALWLERLGLKGMADRYRNAFNFISRHQHTEGIEWWGGRLAEAGMVVDRWQYYFSPKALHALEIGHAQGVPSAIIRAFTGKWILAPTRSNLAILDRWLRPFFLEQGDETGCYLFILARKVSDGPIEAEIPPSRPFTVLPTGDIVPESAPVVEQDPDFTPVPVEMRTATAEPAAGPALLADDPHNAQPDHSSAATQPLSFNLNLNPRFEVISPFAIGIVLSFLASLLTNGPTPDPSSASSCG